MEKEIIKKKESDVFSFKRFNTYMRMYCGTERTRLLLYVGLIFFLLILSFLLRPLFGTDYYYTYQNMPEFSSYYLYPDWRNEATFAAIYFYIGIGVSASLMFSAMSSKSSRYNMFAIPASALEKFTAMFLIYIVGFLVVFVAGTLLADAIRVMYVKMVTHDLTCVKLVPLKVWLAQSVEWNDNDYFFVTLVLSWGFLLQALFALGSVLWPRLSYIKTIGASFVLSFVLSIMNGVLATHVTRLRPFMYEMEKQGKIMNQTDATVLVGVTATIIIILIYWLTYARFKESEMINRW